MAKAKQGDTVKVHYTGRLDDGTVFDTSADREPLEFTIGSGQVIPGFEEGIIGVSVGKSKTITIPSDQAYGQRCEELIMVVDRNEFPEDMKPEIGDRLQVCDPDGQMMIVEVTGADESSVTMDGNHPLAGKDLTFDIELVEIA